nr:RNA polymerase alpha subunit [Scenedesmaceae sp. YH-2023b]
MSKNIQDFFLSCKECILENPRSFYGCFSLGPFKNSQGLTVANALRRTLLSEIHGIAITHLEIDGVAHEYSTLLGIRESILDILLNFKQIVLKTNSPLKKPIYGYLNVRGPGIIRVSDLKLPPIIQCVDPDQYIATLNENGKLVLKFVISDFLHSQKDPASYFNFSKFGNLDTFDLKNSQNFSNQKNFEKKFVQKTNSLWVDPLFNPVVKVNYSLKTIEPIQKNIPNQIVLVELWTNGSIHPRKAFYEALKYLKNMFEKLDTMRLVNYQFTNAIIESEEISAKFLKTFESDFSLLKTNKNSRNQNFYLPREIQEIEKDYFGKVTNQLNRVWADASIQELNLPNRVEKSLLKNKFVFVRDLLTMTPKQLKNLPGIGDFSIFSIQQNLHKIGLELAN